MGATATKDPAESVEPPPVQADPVDPPPAQAAPALSSEQLASGQRSVATDARQAKPSAADESVNSNRKTRTRRSHVTRDEDIVIMRAIAAIKPNDAEWGDVNRRWQRVADHANKELKCGDLSAHLCRSRYKQLTSWFNPNRKVAFADPESEELYALTAAALEESKKRELTENARPVDLRTAFELMTGSNPPKSYEELFESLLKAPKNAATTDDSTGDQTQEDVGIPLETPKRSRDVLAGPMTPSKRRKLESRGVGGAEFAELQRAVHKVELKQQVLDDVQRGVEEVKVAQAQRQEAHDALHAQVAEIKTRMLDATAFKHELDGLRALSNEQFVQLETLKKQHAEHVQEQVSQKEELRMEMKQLQTALEAERERGCRLEKSIADVRQETETQDQARLAVMDTKTALLEKTVADFEAVVQKQQELMALYKQSLAPQAIRPLDTTSLSLETTKEFASLRATIDAERSERTRGQAQLLDILHQIFAKENGKLMGL